MSQWLLEYRTSLGLGQEGMTEEACYDLRCRGVVAGTWRWIGTRLAARAAVPCSADALPDMAGTPAGRWIAAITARLDLDPLEARLLTLALLYRLDRRIERLFDQLSECRGGPTRFHRDAGLIALLLDATEAEVAARLTASGRLLAGGLLHLCHDNELSVLSQLLSLLRREVPPEADFFDQLLGTRAAAALPWDAFTHLGREAEVAARLLRAALAGREGGVNILLHGPPGTGKTSFAATLAAHIGARLRPVGEADENGDEPLRHERLSGLRLAQRLAEPGRTLLLFDEAEDVFVARSMGFEEPVTGSRVFMHRLLEQNAVPVVWTANDIGVLGPAVLRRMAMCLELRLPNLATRTVLWRRMAAAEGVALDEADAAQLARLVPAAPAVAATALRAARLAGSDAATAPAPLAATAPEPLAATARLIVEGVARAVRGGGLPAPEPEPEPCYDPALLQADADLAALEADLLRPGAPRAVSFLIAGPPGAGKSAWVRHLAARLGLPVLHRRASDLLDPFVGGTEQRIAAAFAEARDTGAFLVFDEADSLLPDRADAVRGWEISQVNEMLTWMESHPLPFACTTNLPERLDRASLRRFLVKLRFGYLDAAQARAAFARFFALPAPSGLAALATLTPADFAIVARRAALHGGTGDPAALLRLLAAECAGRSFGRGPLGFARPAA
jgi:transitional endoplasmic reticulum ATPase